MQIKYNKLTIISKPYLKPISNGKRCSFVKCICECGSTKEYKMSSLKSGNTKSCGCFKRYRISQTHKKHGLKQHPIYLNWSNIKQRCFNKNNKNYNRYGGRGITICDEWKNNFKKFYDWAIDNGWKKGLEIDRIDNDGNYEPNNCKFSTRLEQNNNKNNNIQLKIFNESKNITEWSKDSRCKVKYRTFVARIKKGWDLEKALIHPKCKNQFK